MSIYDSECWEFFADTPEQFRNAIEHAVSAREREFFTKLCYKVVNEPAASNDVLMDGNNPHGLYILRVSDDFLIGSVKNGTNEADSHNEKEYSGLFLLLEQDLFPYIGQHIKLGEWLRSHDYEGIDFSGNNDLR